MYPPSCIAVASIMCAFENAHDHIVEWRKLMMTNGVFKLDFVRLISAFVLLKSVNRTKLTSFIRASHMRYSKPHQTTLIQPCLLHLRKMTNNL